MSIADDIRKHSSDAFSEDWSVRNGTAVPDAADLKLANDAVHFKTATVLYADLDASTDLVKQKKWQFAGEIYKTFLYAASRLIRHRGGSIVSYDGDRVMGVFISNRQRNNAVSCALEINYAVTSIVQNEIKKGWNTKYKIRHVVGIDTSKVHAARTGVRGDNDLVWIGNAPNLAAKLTALSASTPTWITKRVYDYLEDKQKLGPKGEGIWTKKTWSQQDDETVYCSDYWRELK